MDRGQFLESVRSLRVEGKSIRAVASELDVWTPCAPRDTCNTPGEATTFGHIAPGVVDLEVDVKLDTGQEIEGLTLKLVCNIAFAGIVNKDPVTGSPLPEGYFLSIRDLGDLGTPAFEPLSPILGITHIGVDPGVDLELDDDDDDEDDDD